MREAAYDFAEKVAAGSWWNSVVPEVVEVKRDGDRASFDGAPRGGNALLYEVVLPVVRGAAEMSAELVGRLTLAAVRAGCEVAWLSGGELQGNFFTDVTRLSGEESRGDFFTALPITSRAGFPPPGELV